MKSSALLQSCTVQATDRAAQRDQALARWDGEGGSGPDGPQEGWGHGTPATAKAITTGEHS